MSAERRWPKWARPYAFEWVAWGNCLIAVVFLRSEGLSMDLVTVRYSIPPLIPAMTLCMAGGFGLQLLYRLAITRDIREYLRALARPGWWLLTVRIWAASIVVVYAYMWLKVSVPLVNSHLFDTQLWHLDRAMHFGISPSIFASRLISDTVMAPILDSWYSWWWMRVGSFGMAFFVLLPNDEWRARFMLSSQLIWNLAAWLYVALPALGPCYAVPELWTHLRTQLPEVASTQAALLENYRRMVAARMGGALRAFKPMMGVAAMPSLHVGYMVLLTLWSWKLARKLLVVAVIATFLTFLGSLATGWHYAVDDYAGALLAVACFIASLWIPRPHASPTPAASTATGSVEASVGK
jgi:hypothetical protein